MARSWSETLASRRCYAFLWILYHLLLLARTDAAQQCERLKASLTYTQEEAPRDLSGVLPVVVERINRVLEGVVDVEVEWTGGDLHGQVGEHFVQCKVTRLAASVIRSGDTNEAEIFVDDAGRDVATQCFHVPFTILDTNECLLPTGHPMRHRCHASSLCVNTIGSYECLCPRMDQVETVPDTVDESFWAALASQERGPWERSFNAASRTSCPAMASTHGCCADRVHTRGDAATCRANFRCPRDPCSNNKNTCAATATCARKASPTEHPDYECQCPAGLMGNGHKCRPGDAKPEPKVKFDGKTPTELTIKNNLYCDCTKPVVDACDGFPPCTGKHQICTVVAGNQPTCACKPGYVLHEKYGCVDESPPVLRLKNDPNGDQILRLKQGDVYKEHAVEIQDENAEEYLRSLKIAYSQPLPSGCLTKIGEFHVNYTVATPWTAPPYVRITRRVIIEDIDECSLDAIYYAKTCPDLVPRCDTDSGATCVNTIGSYTCKCPKYTTGDGFKKGLSFGPLNTPDGFQGGTGCRDTGAPVIKLLGPNPKVFRVCECGGIYGIMGKKGQKDAEMKSDQQSHYGNDIKDLIRTTAGAELCASHLNPMPKSSDCVMAYDETYKGRVDLSRAVTVGEPLKKSALRWSVPYNVNDEAGNSATTVWRDIVVEEVDLVDVETKIREEILQQQKTVIQKAVEKALEEDRRNRERGAVNTRDRKTLTTCPECPKCDCSGKFEESMCQATCDARITQCQIDDESFVVRTMLWLERMFPPSVVPIALACAGVAISFLILRWTLTLMLNPQAFRRGYYDDLEKERAMFNSVVYHHDGVVADGGRELSALAMPPPRASLSTGNGNGYFSPQNNNYPVAPLFGSPSAAGQQLPPGDDFADIYQSPTNSIITPSKRGDGVLRRSPYSANSRSNM